MSLHHSRLTININYQAGQVIAFTMHQAISIGLRITNQSQSLTYLPCTRQFTYPKSTVNRFLYKRKYPYCNASNLEMSASDKFLLRCIYIYYFSFFRFILYPSYGT